MITPQGNDEILIIRRGLSIPAAEISFTFSRSGGSGGQNVNKVNTKAALWFDVEASASLTPSQKARLKRKLANRINRAGFLRVVSYRHRTQAANRRAAQERFVELLRDALRRSRPRRKTRPPKAARERRLTAKKQRGRLKQQRRNPVGDGG